MLKIILNKKNIFWGTVLLDVLILFLHFFWGRENVFFNLDNEKNLPTVYSGIKLLLIGLLATILAYKNISTKKFLWFLFAFIFVYLSFDEVFELHEKTMDFLRDGGYLILNWYDNHVFYWTLIFLPLIFGTVVFFLVFIRKLKEEILSSKKYLIIGFCLFLGVIVLETVGGILYGKTSWYFVLITVEESFEIFGATIILLALIDLLFKKELPKIKN